MMITPRFSCSQTAAAVIVRIYVSTVRASDVELHVDGTLFSVHINPYFLRLVLPGEVIEDAASSAVYDPSSGYLTVTLTKATHGQAFNDLDMLAKLLAPPKRDEPPSLPTIEVVDSKSTEKDEHSLHRREVLEESPPLASVNISTERRYGFLNAYTGYFNHVTLTENEVNELGPDAEKLAEEERRLVRLRHEDKKFDEDHYMADFADDEYIQEIIEYKPPSEAPYSPELGEPLVFTEEENAEMLRLPRKEYLTTSLQMHDLYLTLLTILFSYDYDARTTQSDPTPESAWTICSLTPAFTALDPPPYAPPTSTPLNFTSADLHSALIPSVRRALAFSLYRSFALVEKCLQDVSGMLRHGRRAILRALLETKKILDHHEVYYIYSKIWVDDFCRWVASDASEEILREIGQKLATTGIDKHAVGWDLIALEAATQLQISREPDSDDESESASVPENSDDDVASSCSCSSSTISSSASSSSSGS